MDDERVMLAEASALRLLSELLDDVPGDLGHIARAIVRSAESDTYLGSPQAASTSDELTANPDYAFKSHSGPIPWATRVIALCCQAYNRPVEMAIPIGACLELLGIVSSALDAVQDDHKGLINEYVINLPTDIHHLQDARTGTALVTNAAVALIGPALQSLFEHGPRYEIPTSTIVEVGRLIAKSWTTICHAQHLDLTIGRSHQITFEEYNRIVADKAGAIGGVATEAGALLVGASDKRQLWRTLGVERTIALQLWDDYTDLEEDLAYGQQISHPMLYGLATADTAQKELMLALLRQAAVGANAAVTRKTLIDMLKVSGAVEYTHACLIVHREQAREALSALALPIAVHNGLEQWILSITPTQN